MEQPVHTLNGLFAQLGLPDSDADIAEFVERHKPVGRSTPLYQLSIFSSAQQSFLRESLQADADWAEVIDVLDGMLRHEADIRPA